MPELPEVEYAAQIARAAAVGLTIAGVRVLHRAQRRALSPHVTRTLTGDVVAAVVRRGKYQLISLASGRTLLVHFKLNGDWVAATWDALPRHARVALDFSGGTSLVLVDSRALASITLHLAGEVLLAHLGPEANSKAFSADWLALMFRQRRGPVKVALLDQRMVAGLGNIYACEALWYAHIDPRTPAKALGGEALRALVRGAKRAISKALEHPERYYLPGGVSDAVRFNVYDREGRPCRRCGASLRRLVQTGRSTYYCDGCQTPRGARS